ncbi:MAG: hypothetical protein ACRENS_01140 [Candidatus Eiseniibacteriota bacterium]
MFEFNLKVWALRALILAVLIGSFICTATWLTNLRHFSSADTGGRWTASPGFGSTYHGPKLVREIARQQLFGTRVRLMLHARQYDALEAMADSLVRNDLEFPNGVRYIDAFFERGFAEVNQPGGSSGRWAALLQDLRDWNEARPNSAIARLALAQGLIGRGLIARDPSPPMVVSNEEWRPHVTDADEALRILQQATDCGPLRANWYSAELAALDVNGRKADTAYRSTVRAALAEFPDASRFYRSEARHRSPRWCGNRREWAAYVDTCASSLPDTLRDEIYARIVADQDRITAKVFQENPTLSWERTVHGLDGWINRCPHSLEALSEAARLARDKGDAQVARAAFAYLGDSIDVDCWSSYSQVWAAHEWARTQGNSEQVAGR